MNIEEAICRMSGVQHRIAVLLATCEWLEGHLPTDTNQSVRRFNAPGCVEPTVPHEVVDDVLGQVRKLLQAEKDVLIQYKSLEVSGATEEEE